MLAQVTYIHKFIMADSEDEFMLICVAASAAFGAMSQRFLGPGRAFLTILELCSCVFVSKYCFLCECYPTHHSVDSLNTKQLSCRRLV